ncbi:hypothetical protein OAD67_02365 [bacterium]|nr:hypothetical protein [bacterium]
MREIAEMFVPKSMYHVVPVRMMPPVKTLTGLAGWVSEKPFILSKSVPCPQVASPLPLNSHPLNSNAIDLGT